MTTYIGYDNVMKLISLYSFSVKLSRKINKGIDKLQLLYCSGYRRRLQDQKIWKISHLKLELKQSRIVYTIVTNNS